MSHSKRSRQQGHRRRAPAGALLGALALAAAGSAFAACSSSGSGSGSPTTQPSRTSSSGASASPTTTTTSTSTSTSSGSGATGKLQKIAASVQHESSATFKLVYTSTSSTSSTSSQQVTLEQMPPDQAFRTNTGEVLFDGSKTYYCSISSGSAPSCVSISGDQNPVAGLMQVYNGATYVQAMEGWQSELAAGITGYHLSFSSATFAGQPSECVQWDYQGSSAKYCVTSSGVLAYVGGGASSGTTSFELTSYSTSVSPSDFSLPNGATVSTAS